MDKKDYKKPKKESLLNKGARFTGAGLQMGLTIYIFNWLGSWLDNKYQKDFLETTLTLFAIFASMYLIIVQVQKLSK
jgi:hypothetical protein